MRKYTIFYAENSKNRNFPYPLQGILRDRFILRTTGPRKSTLPAMNYMRCGAFFLELSGFICICPPIALNTFIIVSN